MVAVEERHRVLLLLLVLFDNVTLSSLSSEAANLVECLRTTC